MSAAHSLLPRRDDGTVLPARSLQALQGDPSKILERYLADEKTADIARSLGVEHSTLNYWLLRNCPEQWREAQVARGVTAWEQAESELDASEDQISLARAREKLRGAQWRLEKLCPKLFGQKVEVNQPLSDGEEDIPTLLRRIAFALKRSEAVTVDAEAVQDAEQA